MTWEHRRQGGDQLYTAVIPVMGRPGEEDQYLGLSWATLQDHEGGREGKEGATKVEPCLANVNTEVIYLWSCKSRGTIC